MARYFTVEEANALLPRLRPLVHEIQSLKRRLDAAEQELQPLLPPASGNGHAARPRAMIRAQQEVDELSRRLRRTVRAIRELDCQVKDMNMGLVDFPAFRDGREVYLCWRVDEERIAWWHDWDTGYQGRQAL